MWVGDQRKRRRKRRKLNQNQTQTDAQLDFSQQRISVLDYKTIFSCSIQPSLRFQSLIKAEIAIKYHWKI